MANSLKFFFCIVCLQLIIGAKVVGQISGISNYNIIWTTQSQNSSESMPCGGGDIGLNVWVEKGDILFYLSRSGAFDENNVFPKIGRVRLKISPNPFSKGEFRQELKLKEGYVEISGKYAGSKTLVKIWVDVFKPVIHVETESNRQVSVEAVYENWRTKDLEWTNPKMTNASLGYRDAPMNAIIRSDSIGFNKNSVVFYHRNRDESLFDFTVKQQDLLPIKEQLWNPLKNLTFGGEMIGENMEALGNMRSPKS